MDFALNSLGCKNLIYGCYSVIFCERYQNKDVFCYKAKQNRESTKGYSSEKSSKDMTSSRNLVSTIGALASPKLGDRTRCPEG